MTLVANIVVISSQEIYVFKPKNAASRCLDLYAGTDTAQLGNVQSYPCHEKANQQWKLTKNGDEHYFSFVSLYNDECMNIESNGNINTAPCNNGNNQKWILGNGDLRSKDSFTWGSKCPVHNAEYHNIEMGSSCNGNLIFKQIQ